jgi:chromosome segregation ATPase
MSYLAHRLAETAGLLEEEKSARAAAAEAHAAAQASAEQRYTELQAAFDAARQEAGETSKAAEDAADDVRRHLRQATQDLGKANEKAERLQAQLVDSQQALEERSSALKVDLLWEAPCELRPAVSRLYPKPVFFGFILLSGSKGGASQAQGRKRAPGAKK